MWEHGKDKEPVEFLDDRGIVKLSCEKLYIAMGYSVIEAQTAIQALPKDAPDDVEERLRLALQNFTGK